MNTFSDFGSNSARNRGHRFPVGVNAAVAVAYADVGIPVFPCDGRKRPLTQRGHHAATTDPEIVRRWWVQMPAALVGVPTGTDSGVWVLDIDGEAGRCSLDDLLARLDAEAIAALTPCVSRTPSGGLHLFFRLQLGERPRNRARDIGPGLDTRGVKADGVSAGYFIAPGSTLPDGRSYQWVDAGTLAPIAVSGSRLDSAVPAPRKLLGLATFSAAERAAIAGEPALRDAIRNSEPTYWPAIFDQHRGAARRPMAPALLGPRRDSPLPAEHRRQQQYVTAILSDELNALAEMTSGSGRNCAVFKLSCRIGRWVHHGIISRAEFEGGVIDACERNALVAEDGRDAVLATIASALARSVHDSLPALEA